LKFKGEFKDGQKTGSGILQKENYKFVGNFVKDRKNGSFIEYYYKRNIKREGSYNHDKLEGVVNEYKIDTN